MQNFQTNFFSHTLTGKKLPCGHILHMHCLRSWLERQQVCPICTSPVLQEEIPQPQPPVQQPWNNPQPAWNWNAPPPVWNVRIFLEKFLTVRKMCG